VAVVFATFARTWVVQAFKILRIDGAEPARRGPHPGQQVHLRAGRFAWENALAARRGSAAATSVSSIRRSRARFIKRCVGLPGDTVELRDKQLHVNGRR
jgi:signal peptidase I